jgi:ketosteroid isomerase-like protein
MGVWALLVALLMAPTTGTRGQTSAKHRAAGASSASSFAPLEKWKAAVIAGDVPALTAMYSTDPPATAHVPTGQTSDPTVEPKFWGALAEQGLRNFKPKVMEIRRPQPGIVILLLRTEFSIGKSVPSDAVIGGAQVWQQQGDVWRIVQSQRTPASQAPQRQLPEPEKFDTELYAPPEQAAAEISAALAKAANEHKRVILMFGGNWCIDCHVLNAALHSKANDPILSANYVLVHVNIGEESKDNLDIAAKYDTPLDKGVPALCVLDPDGKVVYSQKQGEFESTTRIGPGDVTAFLKKWKPMRG